MHGKSQRSEGRTVVCRLIRGEADSDRPSQAGEVELEDTVLRGGWRRMGCGGRRLAEKD